MCAPVEEPERTARAYGYRGPEIAFELILNSRVFATPRQVCNGFHQAAFPKARGFLEARYLEKFYGLPRAR